MARLRAVGCGHPAGTHARDPTLSRRIREGRQGCPMVPSCTTASPDPCSRPAAAAFSATSPRERTRIVDRLRGSVADRRWPRRPAAAHRSGSRTGTPVPAGGSSGRRGLEAPARYFTKWPERLHRTNRSRDVGDHPVAQSRTGWIGRLDRRTAIEMPVIDPAGSCTVRGRDARNAPSGSGELPKLHRAQAGCSPGRLRRRRSCARLVGEASHEAIEESARNAGRSRCRRSTRSQAMRSSATTTASTTPGTARSRAVSASTDSRSTAPM